MSRWADRIIRLVPLKRRLLEGGAVLPHRLRSTLSLRVLSAVARRVPAMGLVRTTMGIDDRLECEIPHSHHMVLFGKPALYRGERGPLALAACLSRAADAFVDIGAHVGYFSFHVRSAVGEDLPIHFFEPDPDLFSIIENNVRINGWRNVFGHRQALGNATGTAAFHKNISDSSSGSLEPLFKHTHHTEQIEVPVIRYADFERSAGLHSACVKVDVEGAEQQFMDGAESFESISSLIIEILGPAVRADFAAKLIARSGLHAYYINDFSLEHSPDGRFTYCAPQYNWLFCRHAPGPLQTLLSGTAFRVVARNPAEK